jgi:hypothetical protein
MLTHAAAGGDVSDAGAAGAGAIGALVGLNHMLEARARDGDVWDDPAAEEERSAAAEFDAALRGKGCVVDAGSATRRSERTHSRWIGCPRRTRPATA